MTRFASIMGVAAVATLVLLSGCEAAMEKTDYVEKLEGTWMVSNLPAMVSVGGTTFESMANVNVTITEGDDLNTGTFTVMVIHNTVTPPGSQPPVTATGSIVVDSKNINVTIESIMSIVPLSAEVTALVDQKVDIGYVVTGDSLEITHTLLASLGVADPADPKLTLTKSQAQ